MDRIETLRKELYDALDKGMKQEIQILSEELDKEIVKLLRNVNKNKMEND